MDSGTLVQSMKRVQAGLISTIMKMTSVPISRRMTGSIGYQPLMIGFLLIRVCPFGKRLKAEDFFLLYSGGGKGCGHSQYEFSYVVQGQKYFHVF